MPTPAESLSYQVDPADRTGVPTFFGKHCALVLGGALVALLALSTTTRWFRAGGFNRR